MRIYYRTKILINGIFPLINYKIDDFIEKTGTYDESIIDANNDEYIFYSSGFLLKGLYSCKEKEGIFYEYFENDELFEKEISDFLSKEDIQKLILKEQIEKVNMLQKKLRLITGLGINLPVFKTIVYNSKKEFLTQLGFTNWDFTRLNVMDYNDEMKKILEHRLQFYIADFSLTELESKNDRFKRALSFYTNSFTSSNIGVRFTLLFSALESLFNITEENITNEVSKYASKILFLSRKKENSSKWKIITYYDIRSKFIHGNNGFVITNEIENNLREYVREILFIYWDISSVYQKYDANEIKNLLDNLDSKTLDIQVQLFIKYLRTSPGQFKKLYETVRENFLNGNFNVLDSQNLHLK